MIGDPKPTFSESWHRVAQLRVHLQPAIEIQRQHYRGERWYVVYHRLRGDFFRLRPEAYELLMQLEGRTVEEAWQHSLERAPDEAPTQDEVIELLGQLYQANLLRSPLPPNTAELFAREQRRRGRELRARWINIFSIQIPLWDPDDFLREALLVVRPIISRAGALVWLLVVGVAIKVAIEHWPALHDGSEAALAPSNLPLLYAALVFIKAVHELGHAFACRRFGGEVHKLGVMFLFFSPVPYVDATASWAFRSKWRRIFVASAGMIAELFVASGAVFVWVHTAPGVLHSLAYNVIFIASATTLLFNANPLLRYDGYYILSDLLEMPNIAGRATIYLQYLAERYLFALRQPSPAGDRTEAAILTVYGVASCAYRVALFSGIALFLAKHYLLLGILMALALVGSWTVAPLWRLLRYLAQSPRLARRRQRAAAVTAGLAGAALAILGLVPMPSHFRAPGVVEAAQWSEVYAGAPGYLTRIWARPGEFVHAGAPLLELGNREIELEQEEAEAEANGCRAALDRAESQRAEEIRAVEDRLAALRQRIAMLSRERGNLTIRAPHDGIWSAPDIAHLKGGGWVSRGAPVGQVLDESAFDFSAVVAQTDAGNLFASRAPKAEVRVAGQEGRVFPVVESRIIPANQEKLPSAALGRRAGGDVAVSPKDPHGLRSEESFFQLHARLAAAGNLHLHHGCSGQIRFNLPPEPLLVQWERRLRQVLQQELQL